ncbi:hypothetical protein J2S74_003299 [Evansella vedderi]|uniref:Uncharacterized protein n=1 Tax=Evansella vedderi TaxID=38282 RepID=A0ABT9ZXF5_9BACI|nr:hypothetical protein [Evansella vedderi]MDQ0255915.1 hypothetical protein [Evansella vedderi]
MTLRRCPQAEPEKLPRVSLLRVIADAGRGLFLGVIGPPVA